METDNSKKFYFLHSHVAKEPNIYDVLNEISAIQENALRTGADELATLDDLKNSRNIKIPFTPVRNKTIAYLVDLLAKNYPDEFRTITTFTFIADPQTKKLSIEEKKEYTVLLSLDTAYKVQKERDERSAESLLALLKQFRLFNLTKLIKKTTERNHLSGVIKSELGKNIFTYKNYALDRNGMEFAEDFCFHREHYNSVKKTLNVESIKKIISANSVLVNRRLQKFGILNPDFTDYRESKLDYLLNILMEDILPSLAPKDKIEIKNFQSLRACLLKVEKIIDPVITLSNDIAEFIAQSGRCSSTDILGVFPDLDEARLDSWAGENTLAKGIAVFRDASGAVSYITRAYMLERLPGLHREIILEHDAFSAKEYSHRQKALEEMKLLCNAAHGIMQSGDGGREFLTADGAEKIGKILADFDDYQKKPAVQSVIPRQDLDESDTFLDTIIEFLGSLFGRRKKKAAPQKGKGEAEKERKPALSAGSKNIIAAVKNSNARITPLSNFIEIVPSNEPLIETVIEDLRNIGVKIVIPVYNARRQLYPVKSQQYLISDMEYLLVDPDVIQTTDTIRAYTDSLAGETVKEEPLSGSVILMIEKYLLSLHRQKKAQAKRKRQG